MASLAPAPRTSSRAHPPTDVPAEASTLWAALPPDARRRIAATYAGMMARLRAPGPPADPEIPHADRDASR
jgi:hypothetical protein